MSESFDPYHSWLGISPHEQPPHFYRLLGIGLFESDPAVIAGAADRQMAYVRTFQAGPRGAYTQKLLNELAKARHSLLDANERAAYDAWLREHLTAGASRVVARPSPPPAAPPPFAPPVGPPRGEQPRLPMGKLAPPAKDGDVDSEGSPSTSIGFWILAAFVGLLTTSAIVALVIVLFFRRAPEAAPTKPPEVPPVVEKPVEPETPPPPKVVETEQEGNGDVELVASAAQREGETTLVEQGESSAIDGLYGSSDKLRWNFRLAKPGFFRVIVSYTSEPESVGGRYRISAGDKSVEATVRDSGGAKEIARENIGILLVQKSGRHTLEFAPVAVTGKRLLMLHSIRLVLRP